jgi:molybdopterin-guanine dinucleotide biosynthesis protein B
MPPVVSIVGYSKSGKTTLIQKLIEELRRRGRRVAAVKHTRGSFDMDRPGKDTWRYAEAGAESIGILAPQRCAMLKQLPREYAYDEVLRVVGANADLVLLEGLHGGPAPKVEVHRAELKQGLRCAPDDLLAVVTDERLDLDCPQFAPDEIEPIASLIEPLIVEPSAGGVCLLVNGEPVPLGAFAQKVLANTILGFLSALKGIGAIKTVSVSIRDTGASDRPF